MKLIYVIFCTSDGDVAAVILNEKFVYHEESDSGYFNPNYSAHRVAKNLEEVLGVQYQPVELDEGSLPEDWNFDDVLKAAITQEAKA